MVGFNRIDVENIGEIDSEDVKLFCDDNNIRCTLREAARLIDQYDENGNGRLSYSEFCQLILPSTNDHLRAIAKSREAEYRYIKSAYLSKPIESALAKLFKTEIEYQRAIEDIKLELNNRFDFSAKKCFDSIDKAHPYDRIDRNEIRDFVAEYYTVLSEDDLDAIVRRCDTDEDEEISREEFGDVVSKTEINPVIKKFASSLKKKTLTDTSPVNRLSWRDLYSSYYDRDYSWSYLPPRYSPAYRHSTAYLNTPTYRYSRYHSPNRLSWGHLNNSYRTFLRSKIYDDDYLYEPRHTRNYRDYRYSFIDPLIKRRASLSARRTSLNRRTLAPKDNDDSLEREEVDTLNRKSRHNWRTLSQSVLNYSRSGSAKRLAKKNPWRYTLYDGVRNRLSASPKRELISHTGFSPARKTLKTKFDVAEELQEEGHVTVKEDKNSSAQKTVKTAHTLGSNEEDAFVESLRELVSLDKELERAKQTLALKTDFTLHDGFKVFDSRDRDEADIDDIIEAFRLFRIFPTTEEARLFLARYDTNKNNALTFDEFCEAFVPIHQGTSDILKSRSDEFPNGYYSRRDEFSATTIDAIARVLKLHIDVEVNAEILRQRHEESPYFRYDSAFATLNKWGDDYLTGKEFKEMFQKYGFYPTDEEIDIIIDRFDKDKNGKVSYDEFFDEMAPHSPVKI